MALITKDLARYEQIALILARDVTKGVYNEGDKVSGRSTLAGKYNISPETARKALALLHAKEVVNVVPNSGTTIISRVAAQDFVDGFEEHSALEAMERRLSGLIKERNILNHDIEKLVKEIVGFKAGILKNMQDAEEVLVSPGSPLIGQSVHEAQLRTITGVTVTAIRQDGHWFVSPGTDLELAVGDILLAMGPRQAVDHLRQLAAGSI
ncbi:MAG: GntR family transcriptional regulator [Firmicutes bacterium]|nr:GntR family transcriptional regulator [Bacillota bacterium]